MKRAKPKKAPYLEQLTPQAIAGWYALIIVAVVVVVPTLYFSIPMVALIWNTAQRFWWGD